MLHRLLIVLTLLVTLLFANRAAAQPAVSGAKIDAAITNDLRRDGRATAILLFNSQADLSRAAANELGLVARGHGTVELALVEG